MDRHIIAYHQSGGGWVADLDCGHVLLAQATRHPLWPKPWVETPEGRNAHLGSLARCERCNR
jgi:hypothetical protein